MNFWCSDQPTNPLYENIPINKFYDKLFFFINASSFALSLSFREEPTYIEEEVNKVICKVCSKICGKSIALVAKTYNLWNH